MQSACFSTDVVLAMPNVTMQPSLDDVQQGLNRAAQAVLTTFKSVIQWGQRQAKLKVGKKGKKSKSTGDEALKSKSIVQSGECPVDVRILKAKKIRLSSASVAKVLCSVS